MDTETVFWNLGRHGAPLVKGGVPGRELSLEDTLAHAVLLSRYRWDVARAWPVVFTKNRANVDFSKLEHTVESLGQRRALGFFMSLLYELTQDNAFRMAEHRLEDTGDHQDEYFFVPSRYPALRRLERERTPYVARKWSFWMNATVGWFRECLQKHVRTDARV